MNDSSLWRHRSIACIVLCCIFYFCPVPAQQKTKQRLGDYEGDQFKDERVRAPLARFQQAIETIETDMVAE